MSAALGECKDQMQRYMSCLRANSSTSSPCRPLSKEYLDCRMSKSAVLHAVDAICTENPLCRGLMERDEWKNLGFDSKGAQKGQDPPKPDS